MRNSERSRFEFKSGTKVRWTDNGVKFYGEVTIVKDDTCKVIFTNASKNCEAWIPDYTYYHKSELTILTEAEYLDAISESR